jgi:hypothetical protein
VSRNRSISPRERRQAINARDREIAEYRAALAQPEGRGFSVQVASAFQSTL